MTRRRLHAEVRAHAPNGESLLQEAKDAGAWGGMSHTTEPDEEGRYLVSFSPDTMGGVPQVIEWLDRRGGEWSLTIDRWDD